jgi:hypothetical protein
MRKVVAGISILACGVFGSVSPVEEAYAAPATPSPISLNCTNDASFTTSLASINVNRVISGAENDTFVITNTGSGNCTVITNSGVIREDVTNLETDLTIAPAASRTFDLKEWGTFTVTPAGGTAVSFVSDICVGLEGSGIPADPWLIDSAEDFDGIGSSDCSKSGSYRQTADIVLTEYPDRVTGVFSGTYDGDHFGITLAGGGESGWLTYGVTVTDKVGLFETVSGTLKKIRLRGGLYSIGQTAGGLVKTLSPGALVSEVDVDLDLRVTGAGTANFGMVAAEISEGARLQYVRSSGRITYAPSIAPGQVAIGGLVGQTVRLVDGSGVKFAEIRDSYSTTTIEWNVTAHPYVIAGGLVGWVGHVFNTDDATLRIIRSYASPTFRPASPIPASTDNTQWTPPMVGGLIGRHDSDSTVAVSSFYNADSGAAFAIAFRQTKEISEGVYGNAANFVGYTGSDLPQAPRVSAANLRILSTFQSSELGTSGLPGGAEIVEAASGEAVTGDVRTPTAPDYRWAIEQGNKVGFVASEYRAVANFASRTLISPIVAQSYQTRGVVDSNITGYPALGRVWEICANENNGFPVLIWEQRDCAAPGGDASGGNPGGLSDAEYAEFLKSGLTLEQFLARRLAATGAPAEELGQGLVIAALLTAAGIGLLLGRRRLKSGKAR